MPQLGPAKTLIRHPKRSEVTKLLASLLRLSQSEPAFTPYGAEIQSHAPIKRILFATRGSKDFYWQLWHTKYDIVFIADVDGLMLERFPEEVMVIAPTQFNALYTIGYNLPLLSSLCLDVKLPPKLPSPTTSFFSDKVRPISVHIASHEERVGVLAKFGPKPLESVVQSFESLFGGVESIFRTHGSSEVRCIALLGRFSRELVNHTVTLAKTSGMITQSGQLLFVVDAEDRKGMRRVEEVKCAGVVTVGTARAEAWGVEYLAQQMRELSEELTVDVVDVKTVKNSIAGMTIPPPDKNQRKSKLDELIEENLRTAEAALEGEQSRLETELEHFRGSIHLLDDVLEAASLPTPEKPQLRKNKGHVGNESLWFQNETLRQPVESDSIQFDKEGNEQSKESPKGTKEGVYEVPQPGVRKTQEVNNPSGAPKITPAQLAFRPTLDLESQSKMSTTTTNSAPFAYDALWSRRNADAKPMVTNKLSDIYNRMAEREAKKTDEEKAVEKEKLQSKYDPWVKQYQPAEEREKLERLRIKFKAGVGDLSAKGGTDAAYGITDTEKAMTRDELEGMNRKFTAMAQHNSGRAGDGVVSERQSMQSTMKTNSDPFEFDTSHPTPRADKNRFMDMYNQMAEKEGKKSHEKGAEDREKLKKSMYELRAMVHNRSAEAGDDLVAESTNTVPVVRENCDEKGNTNPVPSSAYSDTDESMSPFELDDPNYNEPSAPGSSYPSPPPITQLDGPKFDTVRIKKLYTKARTPLWFETQPEDIMEVIEGQEGLDISTRSTPSERIGVDEYFGMGSDGIAALAEVRLA
ncbi:hypothetical protein YB2330_005142 [Saitoella coloradoensis]